MQIFQTKDTAISQLRQSVILPLAPTCLPPTTLSRTETRLKNAEAKDKQAISKGRSKCIARKLQSDEQCSKITELRVEKLHSDCNKPVRVGKKTIQDVA